MKPRRQAGGDIAGGTTGRQNFITEEEPLEDLCQGRDTSEGPQPVKDPHQGRDP